MIFDFEFYGDDYEVVWNGGPLLPPRPTIHNPQWEHVPVMSFRGKEVRTHLVRKGYGRYRNSVEWRSKHDIPAHPTDEDNRGRGPLASVRSEQLSQPLQTEAERGGDGG